jgi:DNA-directed RNA polymerase subunit H (RpoH/RPB5)
MNPEYIDIVYRSRITLLDILEERGYDVEVYRKFSPDEITHAIGNYAGLSFTVKKKEDPTFVCEVRYEEKMGRQQTEAYPKDLDDIDIEKTELVVITNPDNEISDYHHQRSLELYLKTKLKISFFCVSYIVNNPTRHSLVPKHEIVPQKEHDALMKQLRLTKKTNLPLIRFHVDPIVRCLGALLGDIIKITRSSPSAGEYIVYRIVVP